MDPERAWVGLGNPCNNDDMDLFYASINLTLGNGDTAMFWHSPWLGDLKPKDVAPSIFNIAKKKIFSVKKGLEGDYWTSNLSFENGVLVTHINEFYNLWTKIQEIHLIEGPDTITWKLTPSRTYSSASAYLAQFDAPTTSFMMPAVWENWAPPKCKTFAWLILQNRVWTSDRLIRRGWQNSGPCQLCKWETETAAHLLFQCRYSLRVWRGLKDWLGLADLDIASWANFDSLEGWWCTIS
jgi:hypothetical protein